MPRYTPFSMIRVMVPAIYAICFHATPVHQGVEQSPAAIPPDILASAPPILSSNVLNYSPASIIDTYVHPAPLAVDPFAAIAYTPNETVTPFTASHLPHATNKTDDPYPFVASKPVDNFSTFVKEALNRVRQEKRLALALAFPILFIPTLWLLSSIESSLVKVICGTPPNPTSIMDFLVFQALDAYAKDNSGIVAFVILLRHTISPSDKVPGVIKQRSGLKSGLTAAFEDVVCMAAIGVELIEGINYFGEDPYAYRWIGLAIFWFGLSGFLRGCNLGNGPSESSPAAARETPGPDYTCDTDYEEVDMDEVTILNGFVRRDRSELVDSETDTPSIPKKAQKNKKKYKKAKAKVTNYDADAESNDEEVPKAEIPSINKRPRLNKTLSLDNRIAELEKSVLPGQQSSGSPRPSADAPLKDKKARPLIHPCVKDILRSERFQRLVNRKRRSHSIVKAKAEGSKENILSDISNIGASENDVSSSPVPAPASSTPRNAQFASFGESSPSIWSPPTCQPVPNVPSSADSDVLTAASPHSEYAPLGCTPDNNSETGSRIPLLGSVDSLNTILDISREWAPYTGNDNFVLGVQAKVAVSSTVEEVQDKDGQILKLGLGTGVFINERGVETSCLRPMALPRPDYLSRLDTEATPSKQDEVRKMSSFKFPRAPLATPASLDSENVDIAGNPS